MNDSKDSKYSEAMTVWGGLKEVTVKAAQQSNVNR